MKKLLLICIGIFLLSGCGKNYRRPTMELPTTNSTIQETTKTPLSSRVSESQMQKWWFVFSDNRLNALEEEALKQNLDLKSAMARMQEAQANLTIARSSYFPTVNLVGQYGDSKINKNLRNNYNYFAPRFSAGVTASYEFDLWGKYYRTSEAAKSTWLASKEDKDAMELTLTAAVAESYFAYMALDAKLAIAKETLKSREDSYNVYKNRFDKGVINEFDLRRVEAEMESVRAQVYGVEQALNRTETALSVLLGRSPKQIIDNNVEKGVSMTETVLIPEVPLEVPSDLISRRPDVKSAEYMLKASNAKVGEAKALLFPSVSINGNYGYADYKFKDLFKEDRDTWEYSANVVWPIFAGGRNYKNFKAKKYQYMQMLASYEKSVQVAYKEVLDAMNDYELGKSVLSAREKEAFALERSYFLAQKREKAGLTDLLDVLDVERTLLQAQMDLVEARNNQFNAIINACKALGGSWVK